MKRLAKAFKTDLPAFVFLFFSSLFFGLWCTCSMFWNMRWWLMLLGSLKCTTVLGFFYVFFSLSTHICVFGILPSIQNVPTSMQKRVSLVNVDCFAFSRIWLNAISQRESKKKSAHFFLITLHQPYLELLLTATVVPLMSLLFFCTLFTSILLKLWFFQSQANNNNGAKKIFYNFID